jgi:uncharacterized protein
MNPNETSKVKIFFIYGITFLIFAFISVGVTLLNTKAPNQTNRDVKMNFQKLEVMLTPADQEQGLQNRTELCNLCGMVFVFPEEQVLSFWMKNTLVPIDIVYLDKDNRVVSRIIKPQLNNVDKTYSSIIAAKKALEIPSSRADELNIRVGDRLLFDY